MTTKRVISGLGEAITDWWLKHDLFDPCGVFTNPAIFIESYAIRGGLACFRGLEAAGRLAPATPADQPAVHGAATRADGLAADAMVRLDIGAAGDGE